jgi:hypothetical protein
VKDDESCQVTDERKIKDENEMRAVEKEHSRIYQSALGVYETLYLREHDERSSLYPASPGSCDVGQHCRHYLGVALVYLNHSVFLMLR